MVSSSFSIGLLVGFLNVGRHLASVFFFVGWYLAVDQYLGMNRSWWSQNRTLKTCRRTPDSGLDTNQTLRTRRSTDFKSASLDYKEGNSVMELLVLQDLVFKRMDSMEFLRGLESALGLEYVIWHPVLLALNFGSIGKLSFLGPDQSLQFFSQLLSFYSVHLTCNTIWGSGIGYMSFEGVLHFVI
ncbi:unnamed protein product [Rhizophagus irregularis]|nr:unnamed protein product [Rhizophagus irregularis]